MATTGLADALLGAILAAVMIFTVLILTHKWWQ